MDPGRPVEKLTLILDAFKLDIPPEGEEAITSTNSLSSRPPSTDHDGSFKSFPTEKTSPVKADPGKNSDHMLIDLLDDTEPSIQSGSPSKHTTTSRRHPILNRSRGVDPTRIEKLMEKPPLTPERLEIWLQEKTATRKEWWNQLLGIEEEEVSSTDGKSDKITTRPRWNPQFITSPTSSDHVPPEPKLAQRKMVTPHTFASKKKETAKPEKLNGGYGPLPSSIRNFGQFDEQYTRPPAGRSARKPQRRRAKQKASFIPQTNPRPRPENKKIKTNRVVELSEDESEEEAVKETKHRKVKEVIAVEEVEVEAPVQEEVEEEEEEELLIEL